MRLAFAEALADLADRDARILLLTGDLGYMALDSFLARHPARFFNLGVAEQNMIGVATGLAEGGFIPFCYSIIPFALLRGYEFIRNGPVLHGLPIRIVGVGAGFDYGSNGYTHYATEDLAMARVLPGMAVLAPADSAQMRNGLHAIWDGPGPAYIRIGRDDRLRMPGLDGRFSWNNVEVCREGSDVVIVTTSTISANAAQAAELLAQDGISCRVVVAAQINPVPRDDLLRVLHGFRLVVTVESHVVDGGLGSLVAEILAEEGSSGRLVRCGFRLNLDGRSGSTAYLNARHGLAPAAVAATVRQAFGTVR
jgi:transketolase